MGFKAEEAIEVLEFDFNPHVKVSGVIPEPTSDQIETFRADMVEAYESIGLDPEMLKAAAGGSDSAASVMEHFGEIMSKTSEMEESVKNAVIGLCAGTPDANEVNALPYRVRQAFLGWMTGMFFSPEA